MLYLARVYTPPQYMFSKIRPPPMITLSQPCNQPHASSNYFDPENAGGAPKALISLFCRRSRCFSNHKNLSHTPLAYIASPTPLLCQAETFFYTFLPPPRLVKTRRAPSRHSRDARVYNHTTTAMHKLSAPPTPIIYILQDTASFPLRTELIFEQKNTPQAPPLTCIPRRRHRSYTSRSRQASCPRRERTSLVKLWTSFSSCSRATTTATQPREQKGNPLLPARSKAC